MLQVESKVALTSKVIGIRVTPRITVTLHWHTAVQVLLECDGAPSPPLEPSGLSPSLGNLAFVSNGVRH